MGAPYVFVINWPGSALKVENKVLRGPVLEAA